jgi:tetratricopeptide (TPR) repeat protein
VSSHLLTLMRKEFVRPDRSELPDDDGFRFGHILIRDAAYESLPKRLRAELHERFAAWLERKAGERAAEYEEILGYHLEQAFQYRREFGPPDEDARAIGERAGRRLASAGQRALARADMPAAGNLLQRAAALLPEDDPRRLEWTIDFCVSLIEIGELGRAERLLGETIDAACTGGDQRLDARASIELAFLRVHTDPERATGDARREVARAVSLFEELGDDLGLARAWELAAHTEFFDGTMAKCDEMLARALVHARRAADRRDEVRILRWLASSALWGPVPADQGIRRCEEILERTGGNRLVEANCHIRIAGLEGFRGRFAEARSRVASARVILAEIGLSYFLAHSRDVAALIEMLAGDLPAAEAELRASYDELRAMGEKTFLSENTALLAQVLYRQGRYEAAECFTQISEEVGLGRRQAKAHWALPRAKVMARRGEIESAEKLALEAVSIWAERDLLLWHGEALLDLAEILTLAGRRSEAASCVQEALGLFERKGITPSAQRAEELLAELGDAT